jgi:DNA-binding response OmpR family regulator
MKLMKSILIIDDMPGVRHAMKLYLEDEGFRVLQAADTTAAFMLCDRQRIDLIILDAKLGNVLGDDILTQLRRRRSSARMPIICVSGPSAFEDGLLTVDPTLIFLQKPFTQEQIMPLIKLSFTHAVV